MMDPAELLRQGNLEEALAGVQDQIRNDPANSKHRVFLFQLLCVLGRWEKALVQLNVAADIDPKCILMAQVCRPALQCEALRTEIFAGKRAPLIFGEPAEWVSWIIQANQHAAQGHVDQSAELRSRAFEAAPAIAGNVDGKPFAWIADADPRTGPMIEAIIDGRYFWVPFSNIRQLKLDKPADLRDVVWAPATFLWTNGGNAVGLIPSRYPGSEAAAAAGIRLARRTEWTDQGGLEVPMGQRLLATDEGEYPLLEVRQVTLGAAIEAPAPEAKDG